MVCTIVRVRALPVAVAAALTLAASPAAAGPLADPAPWVLPVNAFGKARAGDWTLLEGEAASEGQMVPQRQILRVTRVERGVAHVQLFAGPAGAEQWLLTFPVDVRRGPDSNLLYDVPWAATDVKQAKATCTLGADTFPCTRVTWRSEGRNFSVRMAPRVRGSGLVGFEVVRDGQPTSTMTTIGHGTGDRVEWGAGPPRADLEADLDVSQLMLPLRPGSQPATEDLYEHVPAPPATVTREPAVRQRDLRIEGGRPQAVMRRIVERARGRIADCYRAALPAAPKLAGEVSARLTVDREGDVRGLTVTGGRPPLQRCARAALSDLDVIDYDASEVPPPTTVALTLTFEPGGVVPVTAPPRAWFDSESVTGSLPALAFGTWSASAASALTDCYQEALASTRTLRAATAVVTFSVDASGAATDVRLEGKPPVPVERCLRTQLAGLRLDASAGGRTGRVRARAVFDPGTTRPPPRPRKPRLISPGHPLRGGPDLRGVTFTRPP